MKKQIYIATAAVACLPLFIFQSCKEDTTPPVITINGDQHTITAKEAPYYDAGATATDDKDHEVYVISNVSNDFPDVHTAGDYSVIYTAQDRNANSITATRTVSVTYTMWQLARQYTVTDINVADTSLNQNYISNAIVDTNYIYRTHLTNFRNMFSGLTYFDPVGDKLTIPTQRPNGQFSPYIVSGHGTIYHNPLTGNYTLDIHYTLSDTTGIMPTETRHALFVY